MFPFHLFTILGNENVNMLIVYFMSFASE